MPDHDRHRFWDYRGTTNCSASANSSAVCSIDTSIAFPDKRLPDAGRKASPLATASTNAIQTWPPAATARANRLHEFERTLVDPEFSAGASPASFRCPGGSPRGVRRAGVNRHTRCAQARRHRHAVEQVDQRGAGGLHARSLVNTWVLANKLKEQSALPPSWQGHRSRTRPPS